MKEALSVNFLKKAISVLLSAVMVFGVMTFSEFGQCEAEAAKIVHKGIDVSVYQGSIDFKKVKAAGYDCNYPRGLRRAAQSERFVL